MKIRVAYSELKSGPGFNNRRASAEMEIEEIPGVTAMSAGVVGTQQHYVIIKRRRICVLTGVKEELPAMINVEQVRKLLGVSRPTAYQLVNREDFPTIRVGQSGRAIRVPREGLLRWIETQSKQAMQ